MAERTDAQRGLEIAYSLTALVSEPRKDAKSNVISFGLMFSSKSSIVLALKSTKLLELFLS